MRSDRRWLFFLTGGAPWEQAKKPTVIVAACVSTARLAVKASSRAVENGDNPGSWKLEFEKNV